MNLKDTYQNEIVKKLQDELEVKTSHLVPKLVKIVINTGLGEALSDNKVIDKMSQQLKLITGQKPLVTVSKRAISTFKLRAGDKIGLKVTLRGKRMYDFLEKLVRIVLPGIRDFRGVSKHGFDGRGNYSLGFSEITVFPEIEYTQVDKVRGLEVVLVTTAGNNERGFKLLEKLGIPFEKTK